MYNEMGWKMRKDKLQSDEPDAEAPQDQYSEEQEQERTPEIETDASAMARLAQLSADIEPSAFVLDLDKDSFRTDSKRTSLDPNEFGWFNDKQAETNGQKPSPAATPAFDQSSFDAPAPPRNQAPGYSEPSFDTEPAFDLQPPAFKPADEEPITWNGQRSAPAPSWAEQPPTSPAFDEPAPAPQPSWAQEPTQQTPPPAFADPSQTSAPFAPAIQPQNGRPAPQQAPAWSAEPQAPFAPVSQAPFAPVTEPTASGPFADPTPPAAQAPQAPANPRSPYASPPPAQQPSPYASQPPRGAGDGQNINSFSRESVAAGLVSGEGEFSIPKVAPFIVAGTTPSTDDPVASSGDHYLILRIRNLSSSYKLTKDVTTIGRPDSITKNYPDVEIELDDGVSRKHAEIRRKSGEFYVVDVGSTNGTLLNGDLMEVNIEMRLAHGDRIRVGEKTEIVFE
jgi:hypothetical protein